MRNEPSAALEQKSPHADTVCNVSKTWSQRQPLREPDDQALAARVVVEKELDLWRDPGRPQDPTAIEKQAIAFQTVVIAGTA